MTGSGQVAEFTIRKYHRPFVGADGVSTEFEGRANVIRRWLAVMSVQRGGLE
jgi:hypothetical protein